MKTEEVAAETEFSETKAILLFFLLPFKQDHHGVSCMIKYW